MGDLCTSDRTTGKMLSLYHWTGYWKVYSCRNTLLKKILWKSKIPEKKIGLRDGEIEIYGGIVEGLWFSHA